MSRGAAAALGALVRAFREGFGMTQAQLADRIGVTPSAIAHYEAGRRMPRVGVARRLREVMDAEGAGDD